MIALFLLLSAFFAACSAQDNQTLHWVPCESFSRVQCANFSVPLDWAEPSKGYARLSVARLPANNTSGIRKSMYFNPGGPGVSPIDFLLQGGGDMIAQQLGPNWDIVTWDPRGVGNSEPKLHWFHDLEEENQFWAPVTLPGTFESHGNLTNQQDIDFFMAQAPIMDTTLKALDQLFVQRNGANLTYIGSTAGVRDLVALVDANDGQGTFINFYGYSYGTVTAMYLTQMFPERVGSVIIDGVVDPSDLALYQPYLGWDLDIADAETVWNGFTTACAEAGTGCLFFRDGDTNTTINAKVNQMLDVIHAKWNSTAAYSPNEVAQILFSFLYSPESWPDLAGVLDQVYTTITNPNFNSTTDLPGPGTAKRRTPLSAVKRVKPFRLPDGTWFGMDDLLGTSSKMEKGKSTVDLGLGDYSIAAIVCSDSADNIGATTEDVFREMLRISQTVSKKWGSNFNPRSFCHAWSSRATERYHGPWNKETANTVLVIGNEADPITPFRSAKLIASEGYLGDSARLVQRWDFGHTSGSERSTCIDNLLAAYVNNGTLPSDAHNDDPDSVCSTNESILGLSISKHFDPPTTENGDNLTSGPNDPGLADLGHNNTSTNAAAILQTMPLTTPIAFILSLVFLY